MSIDRIHVHTCVPPHSLLRIHSLTHSSHNMIHVRIDRHQPTSVNIYVDISEKNLRASSSTPIPADESPMPKCLTADQHIYDRLFDNSSYTSSRQSTIVKNLTRPISKKTYTMDQILSNVESIQQQYEQVIMTRKNPSTCFWTFKQLTKLLKNLRTIKNQAHDSSTKCANQEHRSPFTFGGETLRWIALPRDDRHFYENVSL